MNVLVLNLNDNCDIDIIDILQKQKVTVITNQNDCTEKDVINIRDMLIEKDIRSLDGAVIIGNGELKDEFLYYIILLIINNINMINIIPKNTIPNQIIKKISDNHIKNQKICPIVRYLPKNVENKINFWLKGLKAFQKSSNDHVYTLRLSNDLYTRIKDVAQTEETTVAKVLRKKLYLDFI